MVKKRDFTRYAFTIDYYGNELSNKLLLIVNHIMLDWTC